MKSVCVLAVALLVNAPAWAQDAFDLSPAAGPATAAAVDTSPLVGLHRAPTAPVQILTPNHPTNQGEGVSILTQSQLPPNVGAAVTVAQPEKTTTVKLHMKGRVVDAQMRAPVTFGVGGFSSGMTEGGSGTTFSAPIQFPAR